MAFVVSVETSQLCHRKPKQPQATPSEWVWLCSNTCVTETVCQTLLDSDSCLPFDCLLRSLPLVFHSVTTTRLSVDFPLVCLCFQDLSSFLKVNSGKILAIIFPNIASFTFFLGLLFCQTFSFYPSSSLILFFSCLPYSLWFLISGILLLISKS